MLQKSLRIVSMAALVAVLVGLAGTGMALAQAPPSLIVDYYAGAGNRVFPTPFAGTLRLDNPGSTGGTSPSGDLWARLQPDLRAADHPAFSPVHSTAHRPASVLVARQRPWECGFLRGVL